MVIVYDTSSARTGIVVLQDVTHGLKSGLGQGMHNLTAAPHPCQPGLNSVKGSLTLSPQTVTEAPSW
ncbi:hypothetical protein ACOMHN_044831 [Nucella lapillus]